MPVVQKNLKKKVQDNTGLEIVVFPEPRILERDAGNNDKYDLGQLVINKLTGAAQLLVKYTSGSPVWLDIGSGSGSFTSLTVTPGPTSLTGAFTVISGTENVSIGADAADHDIDIGSATGGSELTVQWGTSGATFAGAAGGALIFGAAAQTADMTFGRSTAANTLNFGTGINTGAQVVNISTGGAAASSTVNVLSGVATAGTQTYNLFTGSSTSTGQAVNILNGVGSGTREFTLAGAGAIATTIGIGDGVLGNAITIGNGDNSVAQTIDIASGNSAADSTVRILSGTGISGNAVLNLANNPRVSTVDIADVVPVVARTITIGGGAVATAIADTIDIAPDGATTDAGASKVVNINAGALDTAALTTNIASGNVASGTHAVNISTGTGTKTVNIGNADVATTSNLVGPVNINASHNANTAINSGTSTGTVTIGNAAAGAITIDTGAGISIDAATASNITAAAGDFTFEATAGSAILNGGEAVIDAVQLNAVNGAVQVTGGALAATTGLNIVQGAVNALVQVGNGAPAHTAPQGSLYLRNDGSGTNDRAYINTDGATTWTAIVTVA